MIQLDGLRPVPSVSVIVFFYNEAGNLPLLEQRVTAVMREHHLHAEIVLVNDSSTDDSDQYAKNWLSRVPYGVSVRFSRNFGSHAAVAAGLQNCSADCAVIMAADLQDPPELIPELITKFREGFDVVWACRSERLGETWSTKAAAAFYYRLMRWLGLPNMPPKGADFLLVSRKVIDAVNANPEKHTSVLAMILWMGFRQTFIQYVKQPRHSGHSKWTITKKFKLLIDSVVSFSYTPIRLASYLGLMISFVAFAASLEVIYNKIAGNPIEGYSSMMLVVLWIGGAQMLVLGMLGEYLWRAFDESRGRPRYVIDSIVRSERNTAAAVGDKAE
jgi:glycosyltransferase involved in cell wall biosynthesis